MKSSLVVLLFALFGISLGKKQGVAVKGGLLCDGKVLPNAKLQLYDVDRIPGDSDDLLDQGISGSMGRFALDGTTYEVTAIEPELRIFHKCNNKGPKNCWRKLVRPIPSSYIYDSEANKRIYDFGQLDLHIPFESETQVCDD
ncbi:unnamed protein product [Bursaphelenchus xylophilus]|uniref:(pine wood nematode) hypothetical protein n=1 Tax=Bursaphelenchus xylophilus TaxID=6326 RepID=A0A1I7RMQ5_BURXY|nr:unnamed protein product [Bursaphelenchus xylophilus]CAG9125581.1 unnamed protein product [Bursaphelenchus xylophilus]